MKICIFILCLFAIIVTQVLPKQIIVRYAQSNTNEIFRFFGGVENQFYADLGAYDSIARSNTIDLYAAGWDGVNIDASPVRLSVLLKTRKDNINLGMAVGQKDKFVTLYEMKHDGSSTISSKLTEGKNKALIKKQVNIPSVALSTVCERYFYKKPLFFNLDIEGYGAQALLSNDWSNPKCRFEVVFTELNNANRIQSDTLPGDVLSQNNYTRMKEKAGENEIFVANEVLDKYLQRKHNNTKQMKNIQFMDQQTLEPKLRQALGVKKVFSLDNLFFTNEHYDPQKSEVFIVFSKVNRILDCGFQRLEGRRFEPNGKDRPILVMSYNPHKSGLLVDSSNYTITLVDMDSGLQLFKVSITPDNQKNPYYLYIFNHKHQPELSVNQLPVTVVGLKNPTGITSVENSATIPNMKIEAIESKVQDNGNKLQQMQANNDENFSKVIGLLNNINSTGIGELKTQLTKSLETAVEETKQFQKKFSQFDKWIQQLKIIKVDAESKVDENFNVEFLLKIILIQTSFLVLLIIAFGIVYMVRKNGGQTNLAHTSQTKINQNDGSDNY